jgi:signal transduction histidine kinase
VPLDAKEALYRIAQEAMHNTVKHANASRISLRLTDTPDGLTLEVQDDGEGFDPAGSFPGHLGLRTMRERAERFGSFDLTSTPGKGTSVRVMIPRRQ